MKLNMCTWNMNGLARWKMRHKDFIRVLETNDLVCVTETWLNKTESELICQEFRKNFKVYYSCRRRDKNAKRDSGGILVFINNKLSQHIEITENNDEDILSLKVNRKVFPDNNDMYICCTYISPKSSCRYTPDDTCKLDILNSDVFKYKNIRSGRIVILGDLNCRTGIENDFIDSQLSNTFVTALDIDGIHIDDIVCEHIHRQRKSDDQMINENGKKLHNICKNDNLFIVNGRIGSSKQCKFTCHTARGQSVVDYIIMDGETLCKVAKFSVDDVTPLSDHSSVRVTLNTQVEPAYNRVRPAGLRTYYRWQDTDKEQYKESINSVESQQLFESIINNFTPGNTDVNDTVKEIQNVILTAAAPCKVISSNIRSNNKLEISPWYDRECSRQRSIYNRLRNKCNKSKSDSDKRDRDDAKKTYVQLCKTKSTAYNNEHTTTLMREKFTNPKNYWKQIKPRSVDNKTYVAPEAFATHFSRLYASQDTVIASSDENYVVHNEMLDREFTLQEIDGAIKHLKSGKAAGSDDIRNEYISYENKQLKPVLQLLFNEIYNTGIYPAQWSSGIIVPIYK